MVAAPATAALNLPAASPGATQGAAQQGGRPASVTLITGDRVILDGQGRVRSIRPGPGRQEVTFLTSQANQQTIVMPSDAGALIRQGVVDGRLFNVSLLLKYGYDDARRASVPTIVRSIEPTAQGMRGLGLQAPREMRTLRGFAGGVDKRRAHEFWNQVKLRGTGVQRSARFGPRVWLDGKRYPLLDQSVPQIGAPTAWASGLTGLGVKVGVLDSGVDASHPDFAGRIIASANFTTEDAADIVGHGTHVASTAVGNGAASGGLYKGVAYEASLVVGKVCEVNGCQESAMMAGMEWAAVTQRARVINMSIGSTGSPDIDPLEEAVDNLSASTGVLFVISAGNSGCGAASTIASPSTAQSALSVGAVDKSDRIASFSSCGPRQGDYAVKPEITAPGVNIVAARSAASSFAPQGPGGNYTSLSGTSMSSPHVAGAAAILAQLHPDWDGAALKAALIGSASPLAGVSPFVQGGGRVTVPAALNQSTLAARANVPFGVQLWPHTDDALLRQTLSFTNRGVQTQVLNLSVQATGADGSAAPPGMFYLSSTRITVPPGGSAEVDLLANTNINVPDVAYSGVVLASSGGQSTQLLFSAFKEPESYDLTLVHLDRSGRPTPDYNTQYLGLDAEAGAYLYGSPDGQDVLRLPKGRYMLMSNFSDASGSDTLLAPELVLDRSQRLAIDARRTAPWRIRVPDPAAVALQRQIQVAHWNTSQGDVSLSAVNFGGAAEMRVGSLGQTVGKRRRGASGDSVVNLIAHHGHSLDEFGTPDPAFPLAITLSALPAAPTGFVKSYTPADLAWVSVVAPKAAGISSGSIMYPETPGGAGLYNVGMPAVDGKPLNYLLSVGLTMGWYHEMFIEPVVPGSFFPETFLVLRSPTQNYEPWRRYVIDRSNPAPFSPTLNASWTAFRLGPLPGMFYGDPASKLAPMLRRPSTVAGTDLMAVSLSEYGTADGSGGGMFLPDSTPKRVSVSRNGVLESSALLTNSTLALLPVAALDGDYVIREDVPGAGALGKALGLPARSSTEWRFHSVRGTTMQWDALPVSIVRIGQPRRFRETTGNTRQTLHIPLQVLRQQATAPRPDDVKQFTVEVSFDSGATWAPGRVALGTGGDAVLTVTPRSGAMLSLKTTAVSADGSSVQQMLIDVVPAL